MTQLSGKWREAGLQISSLQLRLDDLLEQAQTRIDVKNDNMPEPNFDGYEPTAALEALQLLASAILVEEIKDENLRLALKEVAMRFEALDDWMTWGGKLPDQWGREG
jgi:hypothetical protein